MTSRGCLSDAVLIQPASGFWIAALRTILSDPALPQVPAKTLIFVPVNVAALQLARSAIALLIVRGKRRRLPDRAVFRTLVLTPF